MIAITLGTLIGLLIVIWIAYTIAVVIYVGSLANRYLTPIERDDFIGDKQLKDYRDIVSAYKKDKPINVLILSGGGVRGMVPLHILSYIETGTGRKTGELFDFFAGSSTGAISAAGFAVADAQGNYKFSAQSILKDYYKHSSQIFSSPFYHKLFTLFGLFAPRYIPDNKLAVLDYYFGDMTIGELAGNLLIPVYDVDKNKLLMIKNWNPPNGKSNANFLVKDLVNGSSNPPTLFPPSAFSIKGQPYLFIDPAVILNNPILQVVLYVRGLFPTARLNIVLLGNGGTFAAKYNYRNMFSFGLYGLYQYLLSAPALSSKLYLEFIKDYLEDTQRMDPRIKLFTVNSIPTEDLSTADPSAANLDKIRKFADSMLQENQDVVDKIIEALGADARKS